MKVLNLYACLGGNRYKWNEVADIEVTAVEIDPYLAELYQERFPNDKVIVADAHQYLIDYFQEFDFIWSSPPCPSHSRVRQSQKTRENFKFIYPDMSLYQQILLLQNNFDGKFCIENVIPYYDPLIPAQKRGRHLYWTNFILPGNVGVRKEFDGIVGNSKVKDEIKKLCDFHHYDFFKYKGEQRRDKIARNLVDYEVGKTIFETACGIIRKENTNQLDLFS